MTVLLVTAVAGAGVGLLLYGAHGHLAAAVNVAESRLGRYAGLQPGDLRDEMGKRSTTISEAVNRFVDRQSFSDRLKADLQRADLKLTAGEFVFLRIGAAAAGLVAGYLIFNTLIVGLFLAVVGYFIPGVWMKRRTKAREHRFGQLLGDAVMMMSSSLRAGYSMMQALETVSREMSEPINDEFHRVTLEVGVGISVEEALNHLVQRIHSTDLELMTIAMNVQREVGGNLATILDTIAATIRERQELQGEVRTLTAQGRISAYIISLLPVALAGALFILNRPYISTLWTTVPGYFMSAVAITLIVVGFFVTRKVAQVEV